MYIFNTYWESESAGPSPHMNQRVELFLQGCSKGRSGNPCQGCFNQELWTVKSSAKNLTPQHIANQIIKHAPNKYITIVGGEPTDQMEELIELCNILKTHDFHIMVFTHRSLHTDFPFLKNLLTEIDILVDGQYLAEEHIFNDQFDNGFHNAVGSGNQIIWDIREYNKTGKLCGYAAKHIETLFIKPNNDLVYLINCPHEVPEKINEAIKEAS